MTSSANGGPRPRPAPYTPAPGISDTAKRAVFLAASLVAVALVAFSAGRFSAPEQVDVREVERVVYRDRVVTVRAKAETRVVYRDRTVTPDGTVRERETERSDTREGSASAADVARETERRAETSVTLRPDWRFGAKVGASLAAPAVPIAGPLVVGAEVERRIVGGVSAGVWLNTVGAAGVGLSVEF